MIYWGLVQFVTIYPTKSDTMSNIFFVFHFQFKLIPSLYINYLHHKRKNHSLDHSLPGSALVSALTHIK